YIQGDAVYPRGELCLPAELRQIAISGKERLLSRVSRLVVTSQHPKGEPIDMPFPSMHQQVKGLGLAPERALDYLGIAKLQICTRAPCSGLNPPSASSI